MSHIAMPFLVLNYGTEMIYILEQRLQAQTISAEKSHRVLMDVTRSMLAPQFVQELLRPQPLYPAAGVREIFVRLAHSSVMRMSEKSMDKLFDLMSMGTKREAFLCRWPMELIECTLNHMDAMDRICSTAADSGQVRDSLHRIVTFLRTLSSGVLADVRHTVLNYFQEKRVRVSLFLGEGLQLQDGSFTRKRGGILSRDPPTVIVGRVRYFDDRGRNTTTETLSHPDASRYSLPPDQPEDIFTPSQRRTPLGKNIYLSDPHATDTHTVQQQQSKVSMAEGLQTSPSGAMSASRRLSSSQMSGASPKMGGRTTSFRVRSLIATSTPSTAGLNQLSQLVGAAQAPKEMTYRLNLFDDASATEKTAAAGGNDEVVGRDAKAAVIPISRMSRAEMQQSNKELMAVISGMKESAPAAAPHPQGDSLLDLMDSA